MITVFTPTYNRAYILPKLFESLKMQTSKEFEWLVVDDCSTDNTLNLLAQWQEEADFPIHFFSQTVNGGKHRAINRGVQEAKGDLFFIVDSDDRLTTDAVSWLNSMWKEIKDDSRYAGLSGTRISPDGIKIGGEQPDFISYDTDPLTLRNKYRVRGDLAEAWRTETLRKFPFPEIAGELFCPEALVWNRIGRNHIVRFVNHGIYVCEYLPDGLTAKITRLRMTSPHASTIFYSELYSSVSGIKNKIRAAINYWRFASCAHRRRHDIKKTAYLFMPIGYMFHLRDKRNR